MQQMLPIRNKYIGWVPAWCPPTPGIKAKWVHWKATDPESLSGGAPEHSGDETVGSLGLPGIHFIN